MSHRSWSRLFSLLVVLSLLSSPVLALGGDPARQERDPGLVLTLWQFLGSLVHSLESARGTMDPDGQPSFSMEGDAHGLLERYGDWSSALLGQLLGRQPVVSRNALVRQLLCLRRSLHVCRPR